MSFSQLNLNESILKAITACGYDKPTPIQSKAIPPILEGKDVVACAQTGSGKTAAFVLPALQRLADEGTSKKPRILILTPTRELAAQITKAANDYGKFLRFNIISLVGGMPYHHQIRDLQRGADIIVATPGRLMDHMESRRVDLSGIELLVLDEADRMLDMGFIEDVEYIAKLTPSHRQTLLFSATIDKQIDNVVKHLLKNPIRIDLSTEKVDVPKIKQEMYRVTNLQHKGKLLRHFLSGENIYKAIIFTATKILADKLAVQLRDDGFAAAALHGDLRQNVRNRTIEQLRHGKIQFLVATDVAARGIDISDVTHVINYDLPRFCEDYVHRIGRTGRAGKSGIAISFVGPADAKNLKSIERYTKQRIQLLNPTDILKHHEATFKPAEQAFELPKHEGFRGGREGGRGGREHRGRGDREGGRGGREHRGRGEKRSHGHRDEYRGDRDSRGSNRHHGDSDQRHGKPAKWSKENRFEKRDRADSSEHRGRDRFEKSDRPFKHHGEKSRFEKRDRDDRNDFNRDRSDRFERDSKPFKHRGERSDRPDRFKKSDRPFKRSNERSNDEFSRDRRDRYEGASNPVKFRDSERPGKPFKHRDKRDDGFKKSDRPFKQSSEQSDGSRPFTKKKHDGGKPRWKSIDRRERTRRED